MGKMAENVLRFVSPLCLQARLPRNYVKPHG